MAISTKGISQVDLSSGIKSKNNLKSKAEEGAVDSFSSLINMSSGNFKDENNKISDNAVTANNSVEVSDNVKADKYSNDKQNDNKITDSKADSDKKIDTRDGAKTDKANKDVSKAEETVADNKALKTVTDNGSDSDVSNPDKIEDLAEQLAGLINQIRDILKELLGIGDEEIEDSISALDMNFSDLLDTENVSEFVLFNQGATEVDILIDEQLATLVNDITTEISDAIASFEAFDVAALSDLDEETVNIPLNEENFVDAKELLNRANEIVVSSEDDKVAETVKEDGTDGSFIPENADNNISDALNNAVTVSGEKSDNKNSSSQDFGSTNESIINNLNNAVNNVIQEGVEETGGFTEGISQADIIRQVVDEIKANITNDVSTLEMRLNPESLGKVQITVSSRNGVMQAQIVAETEAAKNAIEENIATLRETLNNQDLKVEDVEVTIASQGFFDDRGQDMPDENTDNQSANGRNIRVNSGSDIPDDASEEEQLETEMMRAQGNSVSYTI